MIQFNQIPDLMLRRPALVPGKPEPSRMELYRGHPQYGLLRVEAGRRDCSDAGITKHPVNNKQFKNNYLKTPSAHIALRTRFATSNANNRVVVETLTQERYEQFDAGRREAARLAADQEDVAALEQVERQLENKGQRRKE